MNSCSKKKQKVWLAIGKEYSTLTELQDRLACRDRMQHPFTQLQDRLACQ